MGGLPNIEHRRLHAFRGGCRARPVEKTIARAQPRPAPARVSICRCLCWAVRFRRFATHLHHSLATLRNLSPARSLPAGRCGTRLLAPADQNYYAFSYRSGMDTKPRGIESRPISLEFNSRNITDGVR